MRILSRLCRFSFLGVPVMLAVLSGCASKGDYGNFVAPDLVANQRQLARDSAKQLEQLYPPAKNHFILQHETADVFGNALLMALREAGFAVQEFDKNQSRLKTAPPSKETLLPVNPNEPVQLALAYILDQTGEAGLYHLTFLLSHQSLTRLYRLDDNRFIPAGDLAWKKE